MFFVKRKRDEKKQPKDDQGPPAKRQRPSIRTETKGNSWGPTEARGNGAFRYWLDKDKTSWVDAFFLPPELMVSGDAFQALWDLHPKELGQVKMRGNLITTPRYQQSYGMSYWFTGMNHEALAVPKSVQPLLDLANTSKFAEYRTEQRFNQVLLNWYEPEHYIGAHSDDERELYHGPNGETTVFSITLQPAGRPRTFRLKPRKKPEGCERNLDALDIELAHGLVVVMGGRCQKTHKHQVPKLGPKDEALAGKRVNITFRCFK